MKKIKRKKLPSLIKLTHKLDRVIQDYFRSIPTACESCGRPATVKHHHCPKSRSNNLRFDPNNLISLCESCHFRLHKGDPAIAHSYRQLREPSWEDKLLAEAHTMKKWSREELNELLQKYKV